MNEFFDDVLLGSLHGTMIDVMTWVVISLIFFALITFFFKDQFEAALIKSKHFGPVLGALIGLIPGCAGAIAAVPMYNRRQISLGTISAMFIATFGDAAFVILAFDIQIFFMLVIIGFVAGVISGYVIDYTPIGGKVQPKLDKVAVSEVEEDNRTKIKTEYAAAELVDNSYEQKKVLPDWFWVLDRYILPAIFIIAILIIFPITLGEIMEGFGWEAGAFWVWLEGIVEYIAVAVFLFYAVYYFVRKAVYKKYELRYCVDCGDTPTTSWDAVHKAYINSLFIMIMVFIGFFIFEGLWFFAEDAVTKIFSPSILILAVLVAILVGMIPGCAPQIAYATAFFTLGTIPFAALAANTTNQSGDAEFALIATEPKTAGFLKVWNGFVALAVGIIMLIVLGDATLIN